MTVEIQSVNRKHLEMFVSLPKDLSLYEMELRKWVSEAISRGQVSVRVFLAAGVDALSGTLPDPVLLKQLKKVWMQLARECGCDELSIDLPFLLQCLATMPQNNALEWNETQLQVLKESVLQALEAALTMKRLEGQALLQDIASRLDRIEGFGKEIEERSPDAVERQRTKLSERMREVLQPGADLDERLLREIALFAERVDIAEEITRLKSHLEQFRSNLGSKEVSVGRKLEFIVQEIGREINTIGSKSADATISRLVVESKSELEKIREQIQNVE